MTMSFEKMSFIFKTKSIHVVFMPPLTFEQRLHLQKEIQKKHRWVYFPKSARQNFTVACAYKKASFLKDDLQSEWGWMIRKIN